MGQLPLDQWSLEAVASHLRKAIASGRYRFFVKRHASEEMENDGIDRDEVLEALTGCSISRKDLRGANWRYTTIGKTLVEGRGIAVVVELEAWEEGDTEILVITVWALDD